MFEENEAHRDDELRQCGGVGKRLNRAHLFSIAAQCDAWIVILHTMSHKVASWGQSDYEQAGTWPFVGVFQVAAVESLVCSQIQKSSHEKCDSNDAEAYIIIISHTR